MVTGPAYGTQMASSALQFTKALMMCNHEISAIFFYQEGVYNANYLTTSENDETNLVHAWHILAQKHNLMLYFCISSALRRGIISTEQALLLKVVGDDFRFQKSSLKTLVQLILNCDRFIQF